MTSSCCVGALVTLNWYHIAGTTHPIATKVWRALGLRHKPLRSPTREMYRLTPYFLSLRFSEVWICRVTFAYNVLEIERQANQTCPTPNKGGTKHRDRTQGRLRAMTDMFSGFGTTRGMAYKMNCNRCSNNPVFQTRKYKKKCFAGKPCLLTFY